MSFFDFLNNMGDLFKYQPQVAPQAGMLNGPLPQAKPWVNPDAPSPMIGGMPSQPHQVQPGATMPQPPNTSQDNLRRMIYMQQLMGQSGQPQGQSPMPTPMTPMNQSPMPPLQNRFSGQMQNPQMAQLPPFAQPRMGRYLGARSFGQ